MDTQKISWSFPDYQKPNRGRQWYIWTAIFFFGMLAYAILTANFLFGLIIIMVAVIIFINNNKKTEKIFFTISPDGLEIQGRHYAFKEIKNFWLLYEPPEVKNLYFSFKSSLKPTLSVPLINQNPLLIRNFLKKYLAEDLEKENESTSEALARVLKI
ncbi:MAG TPA: hypothetical protein PKZ16_00355 [bacterium]|nr:hypothetical protein [bacterium]HPL95866.1 hypothetical protein [bacterium]